MAKGIIELVDDFKFLHPKAYERIYNEAIDDFANSLLSNDVIDKSVVRRICIQLKKGEEII